MASEVPGDRESDPRIMPSLLSSPVRREIVDLLANLAPDGQLEGALSGLTAGELAESTGLHVSTIRFHLNLLVDGGLVASELKAGQVGRPRKIYRFRPRNIAGTGADEAHRRLAELLTEAWTDGASGGLLSPEEAGARWVARHADLTRQDEPRAATPGAWIGKLGRTVDLLGQWGYTPELRTSDDGRSAELTLVDCPFLKLAETNTTVVCGVHRGLLRGAMEAVGEPDTEVTLHPLVGPGRCLATLTRSQGPSSNDPDATSHPEQEAAP